MNRFLPRFGRRLSAARLAAPFFVGAALALSGCSAFRPAPKTHYETVVADAQHDTETAEVEHAKAIDCLSGRTCAGCCDPAKAEEHLQKALVADVTYGPAHNTLGMLYLRQRKLYLAAWEFEYANKLMPERFEPLYNLALVYESADKLDRAIEYASMAFSVAPRNPDVLETLIRTRLRNGDPIEELRPLMKEVLFYETRPAWVCWTKEQLSRMPEHVVRNTPFAPPAPGDVDQEPPLKHQSEGPSPEEPPAPSPKVAQPGLPGQATSSTGPVLDGLFLEAAQSETPSASKSNTPSNQPLFISGTTRSATGQPTAGTNAEQQDASATPVSTVGSTNPSKPSDQEDTEATKIAPKF
jgi:Tfp pilus assembly protein PilF